MNLLNISFIKDSKLLRGFVSTLLGSSASKIILMLATFLFANIMTKYDFGEFSFVRNTLNTVLCMCALNFTSLCTKFTVEAKEDKRAIKKLIIIFLFSIVVCLVTGMIILFLPNAVLLQVFSSQTILNSFKIIGVLLPLFILQPLIEGILRGLMKFNLIGLLQTLSAVFFVGVVYLGIIINGINGALFGIIIYYALYAVVSIVVMVKLNPFGNEIISFNNLGEQRYIISKMIIPIFVMSFFEAPVFWVAQVVLSNYGSMAAIGSMTAIMQVRNLTILIPTYFVNTFLAFAGEMNAQHRFNDYFAKFRKLSLMFLIIGVSITLLMSIFGTFILGLYGESYKSDIWAMVISNLGIPMLMLIILYRIELVIREHQKTLLYISILWNIIWLVSLYILLKLGVSPLHAFFISQLIGWSVNLFGFFMTYLKDRHSLLLNECC